MAPGKSGSGISGVLRLLFKQEVYPRKETSGIKGSSQDVDGYWGTGEAILLDFWFKNQ